MAARTTLPVIGVPVPTGLMGGLDSLLSTVQMPAGVPVATVGVGKSGARNAGMLAAQILALSDEAIAERLIRRKTEMAQGVHEKEDRLKDFLAAEGAE
jgi:5-(carboxyamino)imidazole ribonucleotide mutase